MTQPTIKVLLIEDDEVDREATCRALSSKYSVETATMGRIGLKAALNKPFDVVLLDYRLPDVNGIDILPDLLAHNLPVILLTIEENPDIIINLMKLGAHDYIVKRHVTPTNLDHAITNAIEKVALKRNVEEKQRQVAEQAATLEKQNQQIRELALALTLTQQQERRRIAQTLHDNLQQILHGLHVRVLLLNTDLQPEQQAAGQAHIEEIENLIDQALDVIRTLSVDLSPPLLKGDGLDVAFAWLAGQMEQRHNLEVNLDGEENCNVKNDDLRILIFQMVRELLFNVVKHAGVNQVRLKYFTEGDLIKIQVIDKGSGFDSAILNKPEKKDAFGLYSIKERLNLFGGNLDIKSRSGQGTTTTITIPQQPIQL
ncbi:MAG: response regulator [Anaerolineae bacterium]|nr:response regulator [Anaerolineae bacterium]